MFTEAEVQEKKESKASFYEAEYYQPYFNVDTKEFLVRLLRSLWPFSSGFFEHVKENPDLWGPFWIATSLIFLMTVTGNLANYFNAVIQGRAADWAPDLQKLPWAAIAIYGYLGVLPLIFWIVFKCKKIPISLIQFYCIYGYSLFIYLPIAVTHSKYKRFSNILISIPPKKVISIFSIGKLSWLSWLLIMSACAWSTLFLVVNFYFTIKPHSNSLLILLLPIILCSVGLALAFKFYLFQFPIFTSPTTAPTAAPTTAPSLAPGF